MSRELKFRAYIKPLKRYATGLDIIQFYKCCDVAGAGIWTVVTVNDGIFEGDDIIIEQYTGIKDINGKEIYEGDIIRCILGDKPVEFHDGRYWLGETLDDLFVANLRYDIEVIGNIHESNMEEKE